MSSLRLALKQSLEESGQLANQNKEKERRKKPQKSRRGSKREQPHGPKKRGPGRPRKDGSSSFQSPHRQHGSSGSSDDGGDHSDAHGGSSSSENEFSGSSDNDTKQASVDVGEAASALFKDSDDSGSDEDDSAKQRKQMRKKKKRAIKHHRNSAANRIQNHWKKKMGKEAGASEETPSRKPRKKHHSDGQASAQKAEKGSAGKKSSTSGKALTVPPPASNIVSWVGQLSVEMQREHITAGQRVKVRFETKKKRDGKLIRRRKWYGGLVTGVSTGGSKIRIKYDDGTSEVSKFPDEDIIVDAEGNGRHRVSAEEFLPPPSEREEAASPKPRYQSPSTNDDNSEPRERVRVKKESSRKTAVSPKRARLKLSIPKGKLKDDRSKSHDTETPAPLPSLEIPSSRKTPSPDTGGIPFSHSHDSTESSGSSHFRSDAGSPGQSVEQTGTPTKRPSLKSASAFEKEDGELDHQDDSPSRLPIDDSTLEQNESQPADDVEKKPPAPTKPNLTIRLIPPKATKETSRESNEAKLSHTDDHDDDQSSGEEMSVDHFDDAGDSPNANAVGKGSSEGTTTKSDVIIGPTERVADMKETVSEQSQGSSLAGKKRPSVDVVDADEEPAAKRHSGEGEDNDNERKSTPLSSSQPLSSNRTSEPAAVAASPLEGDSAVAHGTEAVTSTAVEKPVQRAKHGTPSDSQHRASSSSSGGSPESLLSQSSTKQDKRGDGRVQENSSSPSAYPMHRSAGARSPKDAGSPTPLSADPKQSTDDAELSKPVSTVATAVKLDASESGGKEGPVLTGSRNSAFERKESAASSESGGQVKRLSNAASGSDEESIGRSTTPLPQEYGDGNKGSSFPVARSGRRAAQQANQRIAAGELVIQDPFAKKKKKREKHDSHSTGKRKHHANELDDEDEDDSHWVQCDNCSKWRILPLTVETDKLPKHWYCEMNIYDAARSSCDAPEQTAQEVKKKKKRGRKARRARVETPTNAQESTEEQKHGFSSNEITAKEADSDRVKERGSPPIEKNEEIGKSARRPSGESSPKPKRASPASAASPGVPESPKSDYESVPQKVEPAKTKKSKSNQTGEGINNVVNDESGGEIPVPKKRGRKRNKDKENEKGKGKGSKGDKDADNQEWVQCEKCEKWRRLPPHISAEDLPEVWYCVMNSWDPTSASCNAQEEKADPNTREYNIFGSGQSSYGSSGKLSYRNLLFGTGRKQNRPISERTRAAESLFSSLSEENSGNFGHPTVMYAKSSAFVPRKSHTFLEESGRMSFFDLMSHSNLWAELRGGTGRVRNQREQSTQSFDELPQETKHALKELVYHALGTGVLAGHEVLLEAQCRQWEKTPQHWEELRALFTLDIISSLLFELVKDGRVEVVRENAHQSLVENLPRYRRVDPPSGEAATPAASHERSRCMKISKPWKRAGTDVSNE